MNNNSFGPGLTVKDLDSIFCKKCEKGSFSQHFELKRIPALISPTNKETILPIPIFKCMECGTVCDAIYNKEK